MLCEELDKWLQSYVCVTIINSSTTIAMAQGIVTNYGSNLLSENVGQICNSSKVLSKVP